MITDSELLDLYTLKTKTNLTWDAISKKLNKSTSSLKKLFKNTNWKTFLTKEKNIKKSEITEEITKSLMIDQLIKSLVSYSRHDTQRLKEVSKDQFAKFISQGSRNLPISFTELKKKALYTLEHLGGFCYPSSKVFGKGTYIICGDVHGKHSRSGIFKLISKVNDYVKANKIIHIGHCLDDDNDINYNLTGLKNLVIIAKEEELRLLGEKGVSCDIVRKEIILGSNLSVQNQNMIDDYSQTPLKNNITPEFFVSSTICNLHRQKPAKDKISCQQCPLFYLCATGVW